MDNNIDTEQRIIAVAKQVFIEKGYEQANMCLIAERVGINRPALHYYFRTKEKLYEAVYSEIMSEVIPAIQDTLLQGKSLRDNIADIVDIYFNMLEKNPGIPLFIINEIRRDAPRFLHIVENTVLKQYVNCVKSYIEHQMESGEMKTMPMQHLFYTFYALVFTPFLSKPVTSLIFDDDEQERAISMTHWKNIVIERLQEYLCV